MLWAARANKDRRNAFSIFLISFINSKISLKDITDGGYLELVSEFEVAGGGLVDPHSHPTHEFYYVTSGRGLMTIDGEEREIAQGDLVHIPPNLVHSLRPLSDHAPIHCFCFAVATKDAGEIDYTHH